MLVELMAGKAGACHANFQDSTPFRFGEGQRAVDYFGEQVCLPRVSVPTPLYSDVVCAAYFGWV